MNELREAKELHPNLQEIKNKYPRVFDLLCEMYDPEFRHNKNVPQIDLSKRNVADLFAWSGKMFEFYLLLHKGYFLQAKQMHPEYFEQSNVAYGTPKHEGLINESQINFDTEVFITRLKQVSVEKQVELVKYIKHHLEDGWREERNNQDSIIYKAKDYRNLIDSGLKSFR